MVADSVGEIFIIPARAKRKKSSGNDGGGNHYGCVSIHWGGGRWSQSINAVFLRFSCSLTASIPCQYYRSWIPRMLAGKTRIVAAVLHTTTRTYLPSSNFWVCSLYATGCRRESSGEESKAQSLNNSPNNISDRIRFMYSQKWNFAGLVSNSYIHVSVRDLYIPRSVHLFCCCQIGHAVSFLGIFVSKFRYRVFAVHSK